MKRDKQINFCFKSGCLESLPKAPRGEVGLFMQDLILFARKLLGQVSKEEMAAEKRRILLCLDLAEEIQMHCERPAKHYSWNCLRVGLVTLSCASCITWVFSLQFSTVLAITTKVFLNKVRLVQVYCVSFERSFNLTKWDSIYCTASLCSWYIAVQSWWRNIWIASAGVFWKCIDSCSLFDTLGLQS